MHGPYAFYFCGALACGWLCYVRDVCHFIPIGYEPRIWFAETNCPVPEWGFAYIYDAGLSAVDANALLLLLLLPLIISVCTFLISMSYAEYSCTFRKLARGYRYVIGFKCDERYSRGI